MPILLYLPKTRGGAFMDVTLTMSGLTKVALTEKIAQPYIPPVFDGRLILCTHGLREKPVVLDDPGRWITARELVQKYHAHFQYLAPHIKRIDLFICHSGYSGFAQDFSIELESMIPGSPVSMNAPTAQFTVYENMRKWRIGWGDVLPYVVGLSRLFVQGDFSLYRSPYCNMAWAGYPKLRRRPAFSSVYTALSRKWPPNRSTYREGQWFGFGFKEFSIAPRGSA